MSVLSGAPYGYRYVKRTEHADAFYEIDELEAPIVREIFDRYVEQRESIVQIGSRSPSRASRPEPERRTGDRRHDRRSCATRPTSARRPTVAWRFHTGQPAKPMRRTRQQGQALGRCGYEVVGPEQWLRIPAPVLTTQEQYALAEELLERNSRLAAQHTQAVAAASEPGWVSTEIL